MEPSKVQNVNKASSDELLRKFADLDSKEKTESKGRRLRKRQKTGSEGGGNHGEISTTNGTLVERKSLLSPATRRSALLRRIGICRPEIRIVMSRSLLKKIEKTWRKTVEGTSKMFMEKHCNQHTRLRNEIVY